MKQFLPEAIACGQVEFGRARAGRDKDQIVWIPKYRKKALFGELRKYLGQVFRDLARRREGELIEGHLSSDHVHMLISIPPKYPVAQVGGYIKAKVQFMLHATTWARREILQSINSGPEDISCRQLVVMRNRFENISKRKKRRTVD
jgi:REP element-mobilizing transposase RayT